MPPLTDIQQQQILKELKMLQDYTQVLEAENKTRNEERKILQKQIERLTHLQKVNNWTSSPSPASNNGQFLNQGIEIGKYKAQVLKLENQIERLKRENANMQSSYDVLSETIAKYNTNSYTVTTSGLHFDSSELNKKYQQLSQKYDDINYENLSLKREIERLQQINYKGLQESIRRLQSDKNNLSSRIVSLELQIKSSKLTIESKQTEIKSLKNRQISSNQNDLKQLRNTIAAKQNEIKLLISKVSAGSSLQFQIRNVKASLASRQSEIARLKEQIGRDNEGSNKISKLQTETRNLKHEIASKDIEISNLMAKTSSVSSIQYSKISLLEVQLMEAKGVTAKKENQLNILKNRLSQLESECMIWKRKYEEEMKNPRTHSSSISNTVLYNSQQTSEISRMVIEIKEKDVYILRIQDQLKELIKKDEFKNIEVSKLDRIVNSYMQKIGQLQVQLNKLEKNSVNGSVNGSVSAGDVGLLEENRVLNQKIFDLERRICILEETNLNLTEELKRSIEMRNRQSSRLVVSQHKAGDEQLLATIQILKNQIQQMRAFHTKLKAENEYYQVRLSQRDSKYSNPGNLRNDLNQEKSHKILIGMPAIQSSNFVKTRQNGEGHDSKMNLYTVLDQSQRDPKTSLITRQMGPETVREVGVSNIRPRDKDKIYEKGIKTHKTNIDVGNPQNFPAMVRSGQFDDLQKKIQILKQENKGLRRHLYDSRN